MFFIRKFDMVFRNCWYIFVCARVEHLRQKGRDANGKVPGVIYNIKVVILHNISMGVVAVAPDTNVCFLAKF